MKIFGIDRAYPLIISLLGTLLLFTTSVTGSTDPMTMEQINNLLKDGWRVDGGGSGGSATLVTAHADEDFYIYGHDVRLNLKKNDKIITVCPVGLGIYADIFKDDLKIPFYNSYGRDDVNGTGEYKIKMRAPREVGYYKINIHSINIPEYPSKLISYSRTLYVEATPTFTPSLTDSDGDGWIDAQESRAGTDPNKKDTDNDGYWDPQDPNPLDPTIPLPASTPTPEEAPGFEAIFTIVEIVVVVCLLRKK
jgi:hypothetical protein